MRFSKALHRPGFSIVGEFKRTTPFVDASTHISLGYACHEYATLKLDAMSVLVHPDWGGDHMDAIKAAQLLKPSGIPVMAKHVTSAEEIRTLAIGDVAAVLVVAKHFTPENLRGMKRAALAAKMDFVYEIHERHELERIPRLGFRPDVIAINRRDLADGHIERDRVLEIAPDLPSDIPALACSGYGLLGNEWGLARGTEGILIGAGAMSAIG